MSRLIRKMIRDIKTKPKKRRIYQERGRFIDPILYEKLKATRKCSSCGKKCVPEIHHIVPHCRGGSNEESNLVPLCKKCHKKADEKLGLERDEE